MRPLIDLRSCELEEFGIKSIVNFLKLHEAQR